MNITFTRLIRTAASERYLLHIDGDGDDAALELHYLSDGTVAGTLIVLDKQYANEKSVQALIKQIDQALLPAVSVDEGNLTFTIVHGSVLGTVTGK